MCSAVGCGNLLIFSKSGPKTGQTSPARLRPVALLVLLAAAAGTGIVAAGLLAGDDGDGPA